MSTIASMQKVNDALKAYLNLIRAHKKFYAVKGLLSAEEEKEFLKLMGPAIPIYTDKEQKITALEEENKQLRKGVQAALNHIVSYEFVEMYKNNVDKSQTEEWVPAAYVKEILAYVQGKSNQRVPPVVTATEMLEEVKKILEEAPEEVLSTLQDCPRGAVEKVALLLKLIKCAICSLKHDCSVFQDPDECALEVNP